MNVDLSIKYFPIIDFFQHNGLSQDILMNELVFIIYICGVCIVALGVSKYFKLPVKNYLRGRLLKQVS